VLDEEQFKYATRAVDEFQADMGGTELFSAMKAVMEKPASIPRMVVVMTDGEVSSPSQVCANVKSWAEMGGGRVFR
jgi:hypothetical protein